DADDGRSATIENLTKGVIAITPVNGTARVTYQGLETSSARDQLPGYVTPLGDDRFGGYHLGPKAAVKVSADVAGGPQLQVTFDNTGSVAGFAANYVADYLAGFSKSPGQSLFESGAAY